MIEKKNIDRLFQEKFKDFEALPDEHIWENIEAELTKEKKRRVIPFWFRLAGAAAILILAGFLAYKLAFSGDEIKGKIVNGDKNPAQNGVDQNGNSSDKSSNPSVQKKTATVASENSNGENTGLNNVPESGTTNQSGSYSPSANKPTRNINNRTNKIKFSSAVAESDSALTKTQSVEATNQRSLHLVNKTANPRSEIAVSDTGEKNKKADKQTLSVIETPINKAVDNATNRRSLHLVNKNANSGGENVANTTKTNKNTGKKEQSIVEAPSNNTVAQSEKKNAASEEINLKPSVSQLANNQISEKQNKELNNGELSHDKKPLENLTGIANTDIKKDSAAIATAQPNALEELLNEKENNVTAKEQKVNRWQITSNVAPIYFSSTSNGSPLDSRFEANKKTYAPSVSYGVGAKYAITKKFFVKSGVNSVALEYNTSDVIFFQTENARRIKNVTPNIQGSLIQVDNKPQVGAATLGRTIRQFNGDLSQRINYVEVPVELSYQLLDRKFGIEIIGGVSTLVLNKNEVSLVSSGMDMNIGEADNLNSLHFSSNVGVGFKYSFLKRFEANFEPTFKYQIDTFTSGSGNFKPYFFGLYTGLSYRF